MKKNKYTYDYKTLALIVLPLVLLWYVYFQTSSHTQKNLSSKNTLNMEKLETAYFAWGCFRCIEWIMDAQEWVAEAVSGYLWGTEINPTYEQVSAGLTSHREWVKVRFDPTIIRYEDLVNIFWRQIDPTDPDGQFADRGYHYTTAIYYLTQAQKETVEKTINILEKSGKYDSDIVTELLPFRNFYEAEDYHQDYAQKSSFRYNLYKKWSWRERYIKETWWDEDYILTKNIMTNYLWEPLSDLQKKVTQENGTERAFDNEYHDNKQEWIYVDIIDGTPLFSSTHKFDSGTGWPSFTRPIDEDSVYEEEDKSLFMTRTEVRSEKADSHLGHVFPDGPKDEWWQRYCINSAALKFIPKEALEGTEYEKYLKLFE